MARIAAAQLPPLDPPNLPFLDRGTVYATAALPDGGFIIGGSFTTVNGLPHAGVAKIGADGTLDSAWSPSIDGTVAALAVDGFGHVYVGGIFAHANGAVRNSVAKLDLATGALDAAWKPSAYDVRAIAIGADGSVYLGGGFEGIGSLRRDGLARLDNVTGAVDGVWNPIADRAVNTLAFDSANRLYAGGEFSSINVGAHMHVVRLDPAGTGAADATWNPSADRTVYDIAAGSDGFVYVGGTFTYVSPAAAVHPWLARFAADGNGAADLSWNPAPNGPVRAMTFAGGNLYVGGSFSTMGGAPHPAMVRLDASGAVDPSWNPGFEAFSALVLSIAGSPDGTRIQAAGGFSSVGSMRRFSNATLSAVDASVVDAGNDAERPGVVDAIAMQPDGGVVVGGTFSKVGNLTRRNLARLQPDRTLDPDWNPDPNTTVLSLLAGPANVVYAGGYFDTIGGLARREIAKIDAGGEVDASWNPSIDRDGVLALAWAADGDIYVGGGFTKINGISHPYLAKVPPDGSGAPDPDWIPAPNAAVSALALGADGAVYAGGTFTQVNGLNRPHLAKLQETGEGAADALWNPAADDVVNALVLGSDGALYAGGEFGVIGGQPVSKLAKVDAAGTGSVDPSWSLTPDANVLALAMDGEGNLYVGSELRAGAPPSQTGLERLSATTAAVDTSWNPGVNGSVGAIALGAEGVVHAGGSFTSVSGVPRGSFAAFPSSATVDTVISITSIDPDPSIVGEPYTVSFAVDSTIGTPTGIVTLYDHLGGSCETQLVDGSGTCMLTGPSAAGEVSVKAVYSPDDDMFAESETDTLHEVVRAPTTIVLSPGGFSNVTEPVEFFANLGSVVDVEGGTVTIGDGESSCTAEVVFFTASCEVVFARAGLHEVTATYSGDDEHEPAVSDPTLQTVQQGLTLLRIASQNPNPSIPAQPVTVTVDLSLVNGPGPVTGTISVDATLGGGSCTIELPATSCEVAFTQRGVQEIAAHYLGNADFLPSDAFSHQNVNWQPIANDDVASTNEDQPFTVNATDGVLANDEDPDGGTLVVADPGPRTADGIGGSVVLFYDGSYEYTPPPNANGDATFEYTLSDGLENAAGPARVTIHVRPVNDPPAFTLAANPHFGPGPAGVRETPGFATMTSAGPGESDHVLAWHVRTISDPSGVLSGAATIALDGTLSTPLSGQGGVATLAVSLQDDGGTDNGGNDTSSEQTFTLTVSAGADLSVSIYDGVDFLAGGGIAIYEITVRNLGGDDVTSAHATIGASAYLSELEWTCAAFDGATCTASGSGVVSDTLALPSGSSAIYELTANVAANPEFPAEITATISALTGATDFNPANDSAYDVDAVGIFADGFDPPQMPPGR